MICRNEEMLCSCVRWKRSREASAARGIEIGVSYTPSGKRLARLERARLACRRYSSSEIGLWLKDSRDRTRERISEKDILIRFLGERLRSPQKIIEKCVERIVVRIGQERMDFADRAKERFGLRTNGLVKFIIVMGEICEVFARRDLCGDIGEDDVVEERVPRERHTVETASSSVLLLRAKFIKSRGNCGVEVLHGESGGMERGADGIPQVRIVHKVLTSFLTFVKYIITFFLRNVKRERWASEGTEYRASSNSIKSLAELNLMEKDFYFNW